VNTLKIQVFNIDELCPAEYNPRIELQPGMEEYEDLEHSLTKFGMVEPVVYNVRTGRLVGGHQRLNILRAHGQTEVEASVVDLDPDSEKILNTALNKIKGHWDTQKLKDLLVELQEAGTISSTGFKQWELQQLTAEYGHIEDLLAEGFGGVAAMSGERDTFDMTFTLPLHTREQVEAFISSPAGGKASLVELVLQKARGEI